MLVVPALPTTRKGRGSAESIASSASGRMRRRSSAGTTRTAAAGRPASRAALAIEWWACSETYSVASRRSSPRRSCRAATSAEKLAIDPPVVKMPSAPSGRPNSRHSQRSRLISIAANAGAGPAIDVKRLVTHEISSASAAAYRPPPGM